MKTKFHIYHSKYFKREAKQFLHIFQPQQTRIQSVHIQKQHYGYGLYSNVKRHLLCCYLLPIKTQPQTVCVEGLMWATNKSPLPPHIWLSYKICILGEKGA